jgi:hypothetical protein
MNNYKDLQFKDLYRVRTTFLGADEPTELYFEKLEDASKFYFSCKNGEFESVRVYGHYLNNNICGDSLDIVLVGAWDDYKVTPPHKMCRLYVSDQAIEKAGLSFFQNLKTYDIKKEDFNGFVINGYDDEKNHFAGVGIKNLYNDLCFYDKEKNENLVFVKWI